MKRIGMTVVALCGLALLAPAVAQNSFFALRVCNNSGDSARVAIHGKAGGWIVKGWWVVAPGQCKDVETLEQGIVDVYAEVPGTTRIWGAGAAMCVPKSYIPFVRDNYSGYVCGPNEVLRPAQRLNAITQTGVYIWHLDP